MKNRFPRRVGALCLAVIAAGIIMVNGAIAATVSESRVMMGTEVRIVLCSEDRDPLIKALAAAFEEISRVERLMSAWDPASGISAINGADRSSPVRVDGELFGLIEEAMEISRASDGAFDITVKPLVDCWNFASDPFRPPAPEAIARSLTLIGSGMIRLDRVKRTVFFEKVGMKISLGGIAKGYAADRAWAVIRSFGITDGVVSAGGDLKAMGKKEDGGLWTVGIKNPRTGGNPISLIPLSNTAVATSGDYERFRIVEGVRYHHILDPRSGAPATGCMSATVLAKRAFEADAFATAVFVLGPERGMAFLEGRPDLEGLIVDGKGRVTISSGLQVPGQ